MSSSHDVVKLRMAVPAKNKGLVELPDQLASPALPIPTKPHLPHDHHQTCSLSYTKCLYISTPKSSHHPQKGRLLFVV